MVANIQTIKPMANGEKKEFKQQQPANQPQKHGLSCQTASLNLSSSLTSCVWP